MANAECRMSKRIPNPIQHSAFSIRHSDSTFGIRHSQLTRGSRHPIAAKR